MSAKDAELSATPRMPRWLPCSRGWPVQPNPQGLPDPEPSDNKQTSRVSGDTPAHEVRFVTSPVDNENGQPRIDVIFKRPEKTHFPGGVWVMEALWSSRSFRTVLADQDELTRSLPGSILGERIGICDFA